MYNVAALLIIDSLQKDNPSKKEAIEPKQISFYRQALTHKHKIIFVVIIFVMIPF